VVGVGYWVNVIKVYLASLSPAQILVGGDRHVHVGVECPGTKWIALFLEDVEHRNLKMLEYTGSWKKWNALF
jgi:hypothetical protein